MQIVEARLQDLDAASRALRPMTQGRQADWVRADAHVRNTAASLALAGNEASLEHVRHLHGRGRTGGHHALTRIDLEIANHLRFYDRLRTMRAPRSAEDLEEIHASLFHGIMEDAGQLRDPSQDALGPSEDDASLLSIHERLDASLRELATMQAHPAVAAAVLAHDIDRIRPFRDGNARLARALNHILLEAGGHHGVRLALIDDRLARHGARFHAVREAARQSRDAASWGRFLAHQIAAAFEEARGRVTFAAQMPRHLNQRQWLVADWFAERDGRFPGRRARFRDVAAEFGWVATRTLKRDLSRLREEGILVMEGRLKGADYHMAEHLSSTPAT